MLKSEQDSISSFCVFQKMTMLFTNEKEISIMEKRIGYRITTAKDVVYGIL